MEEETVVFNVEVLDQLTVVADTHIVINVLSVTYALACCSVVRINGKRHACVYGIISISAVCN